MVVCIVVVVFGLKVLGLIVVKIDFELPFISTIGSNSSSFIWFANERKESVNFVCKNHFCNKIA